MKKIHLIEAVQSFFQSDLLVDQKAIYHPSEIAVHLNSAFNQAVYSTWLNGKKYSDFSQLDAWSKTYVVNVLSQVGTVAYCLLPFAPVQLPNGDGIRQICNHADRTNVFAPIESTANVVFAELEVNTMDTTPTYSLEQDNHSAGAGYPSHQLRLEKMPVAPNTIISLDVLIIVGLEQLDDYDDLALPSGAEDNLIRQTVELMSRKTAPDTLTDAVAKAPNTTIS
jgi:hypothetical protein